MTKQRPLSNSVKWTLEDIYHELEQADHTLAKLMEDNTATALTRTGYQFIASRATNAIRSAKEHIVTIHPTVRAIIKTKQRRPL